MVKLAKILSHFQPISALVIGDFLFDTYTTGCVKRISPEAPVPVMEVQRQESRPGGAGNVALSLIALGARVMVLGRLGSDLAGEQLQSHLVDHGIACDGLLIDKNYATPVKNRLIADGQQLLRVDVETICPLSDALVEPVMQHMRILLPQVQVVVLSDYGKGFLTPSLTARIIALANECKVPVIVDPKGSDFTKYRGATIIKPNLSEAYAAAQMTLDQPLEAVAQRIIDRADVDLLLITRSEAGMSLFDRSLSRQNFPVQSRREVKDVTGAGDTVLAVISAAIANGLEIEIAVRMANTAAGICVERLGCAQVTLSELARRLLESDTDMKIFDDSHTFALRQVLRDKSYSVLVLSNGQKMSNALFRALRSLGGHEEELIVYVSESSPDDEFIQFLSSLQEVNYIVLQTESLKSLCESIQPRQVYCLNGEQLQEFNSPAQMLSEMVAASQTISKIMK